MYDLVTTAGPAGLLLNLLDSPPTSCVDNESNHMIMFTGWTEGGEDRGGQVQQ